MDQQHDIPAAPGTLDPDALPWPPKPSKADLGVRVLSLTFEGEWTLTEHDGEYVLHIEHGPVKFTQRLSVLDLWGIRSMFRDEVAARANEDAK